MIILLTLLIVLTILAYVKLEKKNTKLKQEITHLKEKNASLERDIRDQANKNIILDSLIKQRLK